MERILVDIRCPAKQYIRKYKSVLACQNLVVRVEPGSKGEAYCRLKNPQTNIVHGTFDFDVHPDYKPEPKKIIKVKKMPTL